MFPPVPHFEEEGRINPPHADDKMPTHVYAAALDRIVFTCVDIAFTCQGRVLLAKRDRYPRKSWWIMGGRMIAGESPLDAVSRKAAEEAQIKDLSPERFRYIGAYSTCFARRHQEPAENGSHSVNLTYQVELTAEEKEQLTLNDEYGAEWSWVEFAAVEQFIAASNALDQCLLNIIQNLTKL